MEFYIYSLWGHFTFFGSFICIFFDGYQWLRLKPFDFGLILVYCRMWLNNLRLCRTGWIHSRSLNWSYTIFVLYNIFSSKSYPFRLGKLAFTSIVWLVWLKDRYYLLFERSFALYRCSPRCLPNIFHKIFIWLARSPVLFSVLFVESQYFLVVGTRQELWLLRDIVAVPFISLEFYKGLLPHVIIEISAPGIHISD